MSGNEDPQAVLWSAFSRTDGLGVVAALSAGRPDALQLAGDGLLVALAQSVDGAPELARWCTAALHERAWQGDDELAEQLEAALGDRPIPMLRPLPVDLEQLGDILEGDPAHGGGRIDLHTGEVWPEVAIEYARETEEEDFDEENPERWLDVWCEGSGAGYQDMVDFIATVADEDCAARLSIAISGPGAFRRFKDVLSRYPGELHRWYAYSAERLRGRARAWLAGEGYAPRFVPPVEPC